jgi:hypothetical protein
MKMSQFTDEVEKLKAKFEAELRALGFRLKQILHPSSHDHVDAQVNASIDNIASDAGAVAKEDADADPVLPPGTVGAMSTNSSALTGNGTAAANQDAERKPPTFAPPAASDTPAATPQDGTKIAETDNAAGAAKDEPKAPQS